MSRRKSNGSGLPWGFLFLIFLWLGPCRSHKSHKSGTSTIAARSSEASVEAAAGVEKTVDRAATNRPSGSEAWKGSGSWTTKEW